MYNKLFNIFFDVLVDMEGYESSDKFGGNTIFGITQKFYPADYEKIYELYIYEGRKFTENVKEAVKNFYFYAFWNERFEAFKSPLLALLVSNIRVNHWNAVEVLQIALNKHLGKALIEDNNLGDKTLHAVNSVKYQQSLISAFIFEMGSRYDKISDKHNDNRGDFLGWLNRLYLSLVAYNKALDNYVNTP